jgi:cysteine desulfurase
MSLSRRIYLDFNASTPIAPEVIAAMRRILDSSLYGNPSSGHWAGGPGHDAVEVAREGGQTIVGAVGAPKGEGGGGK